MPNRVLRQGILSSKRINALSTEAELFYRRLMSVVDDFGRFEADTRLLRSSCWPLTFDSISNKALEDWLVECQRTSPPLITVYEVNGKQYLEMDNFEQRTRSASKYPGPSDSIDPLPQGKVYFIQSQQSKRIKIGYTEIEVTARASALQTGSNEKLTILGSFDGSMQDEREVHKDFAMLRISGEWFESSEELLQFIARKCAQMRATSASRARSHTPTSTTTHTTTAANGRNGTAIESVWCELWEMDPYGTNEVEAKGEFFKTLARLMDPGPTATVPQRQYEAAVPLVGRRRAWLKYCEDANLKPTGTIKWLGGDCLKEPPAIKPHRPKSMLDGV